MSNLGPLTTAYQPYGTGCQTIHLGLSTGASWLQQGTISGCLPSNFQPEPSYYYSPGVCPQGYTYACTAGVIDGTSVATAATCCPSNFVCMSSRGSDTPNACVSTMPSANFYVVDVLSYLTHSPTFINTTSIFYDAGNIVQAKGPIVRRAEDDTKWPQPTPPSTSTTGTTYQTITNMPAGTDKISTVTRPNSSGYYTASIQTARANSLSVGAKVGIGLGVSLGVLFFLGSVSAAYIIGMRKGRSTTIEIGSKASSSEADTNTTGPGYELDEQRRALEMASYREPVELMSSY
ncbi:hypothetical protein F4813DRAFT_392844 [Daldinia decipiens]|uniref:uncharacterized protein n=1 Tax=Daldinia decipiens TaxID=326647 RepID=UPI0020C52D31|nr:uncharacterized protein F4813DRAFT_392844 [Daldinia decipiens]KAI1654339.1 hypothetical protein F4813DRAFT_392844 [Daldinia decipiens]